MSNAKALIYLDYHATTPVDPRVMHTMLPFFSESFGNPASSTHSFGWKAEASVNEARKQVAALIGAKDKEIIFTSGATESNNLAIFGVLNTFNGTPSHFITSEIEHSCVLAIAKELENRGVEVSYLPVNKYGQVEPDTLLKAIKPTTRLVSIMLANNEIGTINNVSALSKIVRLKGIPLHVDGAQAVGKIPVNVYEMGIDILSISAHKFYGPKGIGALFIRGQEPKIRLTNIIHGGGQERGIRPGSLNVPGIVGLGKACEIFKNDMNEEIVRTRRLRDILETELKKGLENITVNGHPTERLPMNLNISFSGCMPDLLIESLTGVAASSGSACSSASMHSSHVLKAIGVSDELARSTLRFGVGRYTSEEDILKASEMICAAVKKCRSVKFKELGT